MERDRTNSFRISIITSVFLPEAGGSPISVYNRSIELAKSGHKIQLLIPDYKENRDKEVLKQLQDLGITVTQLPTKKSKWVPMGLVPSPRSKQMAHSQILDFRPDILMVDEPVGFRFMCGYSLDIPFLRKAGIYTCAIVHANAKGVLLKLKKLIFASIMNWVSKLEYKKYNLTVLSSSYLENTLRFIKNGEIINHLGVNKDTFQYHQRTTKSDLNILYFGRIAPEKNIKFLVNAAKKFYDNFPNITWNFIGDGPELEYWRNHSSEGINFIGAKHGLELYEYLKEADVFVTACEIEAFGLTVVEAMASGLPVLVPDKGAASSHFVEGESGFSFQTNNENDFLGKLEYIVSSDKLRKDVGKNASLIPVTWKEGSNNIVYTCINEISSNSIDSNLYSKLKTTSDLADLKLRTDTIMNEYKETLSEIREYQKNTIQNLYVSLIFIGVAIGIGNDGVDWIYPLMQVALLIFFFIGYKLEQDTIIDSAYVVNIEKRVNLLLGQNLINWQDTIGAIHHSNGIKSKSFTYQIGGVILGIIYFVFYLIFCFLFSKTLTDWKIPYLISSIAFYILIFFLFTKSRKKTVEDAILRMYRDYSLFVDKLNP